jgi:hypothetical protein
MEKVSRKINTASKSQDSLCTQHCLLSDWCPLMDYSANQLSHVILAVYVLPAAMTKIKRTYDHPPKDQRLYSDSFVIMSMAHMLLAEADRSPMTFSRMMYLGSLSYGHHFLDNKHRELLYNKP